jgi:hypothetical protein
MALQAKRRECSHFLPIFYANRTTVFQPCTATVRFHFVIVMAKMLGGEASEAAFPACTNSDQ